MECFNNVKSKDKGATVDGANYLILMRERVEVRDNHLIETSKVND